MSDKLETITLWLDPLLAEHKQEFRGTPFVLGISGVQGSGKSTLVSRLEGVVQAKGYKTAQVSLDDLYKTFEEQSQLAKRSGISLWQTRGQFGTHDLELSTKLFRDLRGASGSVAIPRYDKSLHSGRGDRLPKDQWTVVERPLDLVILEGWGVGFQALDETSLKEAYQKEQKVAGSQTATHKFEEIEAINSALQAYNDAFMGKQHFDAFIILQAEEMKYVYKWRLEQEHAMWKAKGSGMTDDDVEAFIDRYYPSYELYLPRSISSIFGQDKKGRQLNLKLNAQRNLQGVEVI